MIYAGDVFDLAMAVLDELDDEGLARNERTEDYENRAPGILNSLIAEVRFMLGEREDIELIADLEDALDGVEQSYAAGVLHYGLAAALIFDENPAAAEFLEERYEENRDRWLRSRRAVMEAVENIYGM